MANRYLNTGQYIKCKVCTKDIYVMPFQIGRKKFCSKKCFYLGREVKNTFKKGHQNFVPQSSRGHTEESKRKISLSSIGKHCGNLAWNWKVDRTTIKMSEKKHEDGRYKEWMLSVKKRDGWECEIN